MDYETKSNAELYELLKQRLPELLIDEVNDFNRETMISYLKISEGDY